LTAIVGLINNLVVSEHHHVLLSVLRKMRYIISSGEATTLVPILTKRITAYSIQSMITELQN
jgi:hypothetical protein